MHKTPWQVREREMRCLLWHRWGPWSDLTKVTYYTETQQGPVLLNDKVEWMWERTCERCGEIKRKWRNT